MKPLAEEDVTALEKIMDKHGLHQVLFSISEICTLKSEHTSLHWQDEHLSTKWAALSDIVCKSAQSAQRMKL